ncbi:MAG: zf-HC2 domain-containing protein [Fibrobacteres bacterium]|jgi:hypothetical protein|nr:zf-HC2 domain-containing protein [Fibrobacterota bacterium]
MMKMFMISCLDSTMHHSRKMDGALGLMGRLALKIHLAHCPPCTQAASSMDLLRLAMRNVAAGDTPHGDRLVSRNPPSSPQ